MKSSFGKENRIANRATKATSERNKFYCNVYKDIYDY